MEEKKKAEDAKRNGKQPPKKSAHMGRKAAGTAAILALLAGGGYFGLGVGNPNGGLINASTPAVTQEAQTPTEALTEAPMTQEPTSETQPVTTAEEGVLVITVKEHDIIYGGKIMSSIDELSEALMKEYKEGNRIRLTDEGAIKDEYDQVKAQLEKLNVPFEEIKTP